MARIPRAAQAALASLAVGMGLALAAPREWRLDFYHGFLLGGALYAGALRRYVARRGGAGSASGFWRGALWRAAALVAFAATQAYVCFELAPSLDVRAIFVILSSWVVAETVLDPGVPRAG